MYHLEEIIAMNRASAPAQPVVRHCSFLESRGGVVLHSANQRATVFLEGRHADSFKRKISRTHGANRRDRVIESYFN